jgi:molybdopterin-guanine dinucleotide biosynthesis protein A
MARAPEPLEVGAIVLAGGTSQRMAGGDKLDAEVGGEPILARVVAAACAAGARRVVVVGPTRPGVDATFLQEDPPGGGPAAGLAAGLAVVDEPLVLVLAGDLPFVDAESLRTLLDAAWHVPGAVAVDEDDQPQWLLGAWVRRALANRIAMVGAGSLTGRSVRSFLEPLEPARVRLAAGSGPPPWFDCDTPDDLARARRADAARP